MIPNTDEARKTFDAWAFSPRNKITDYLSGHELNLMFVAWKAAIEHNRAQGQQPYGYARCVTEGIGGERIFHSFAKTREGWNDDLCEPLYTNAQPVAELALKAEIDLTRKKWLGRDYDHLSLPDAVGKMRDDISAEAIRAVLEGYINGDYYWRGIDAAADIANEMAAKLRKGEPL